MAIPKSKLDELKGLSAQDRSLSDQSKLEDISTTADNNIEESYYPEFTNSKKKLFKRDLPKFNFWDSLKDNIKNTSTNVGLMDPYSYTEGVERRAQSMEDAFQKDKVYREEWQEELANIQESDLDTEELDDFEKHLNEVSPYYRKFKGSKIDLDYKELEVVKNMYENSLNKVSNTQADADYELDKIMQDIAANNQSLIEKYGHAAMGIVTSGTSAIAGLTGALIQGSPVAVALNYDEYKEAIESGELPKNISFAQYQINKMMDNSMSRWGEALNRTGYWKADKQKLEEEMYGNIGRYGILETIGEQDAIFDVNTIPKAIQSHGFTMATMLASMGLSSAAGAAAKGYRALKYVNAANKATTSIEKIEAARKSIETARKISNNINRYLIPSITATGEAAIEGLETKLNIINRGESEIKAAYADMQQAYNEAVNNFAGELILDAYSKGNYLSEEDAYIIAKEHYAGIEDRINSGYEQSMKHVEAVAMQQGANVFIMNQAINGAIAMSFKAGLQAPSVQKAITKGKTILSPNPIRVAKDGTTSIAKTPIADIFGYIKEPFGEAAEEALQSIASGTTEGVAEYSISEFIKNKYNGDAMYVAGDYIGEEWSTAWKAMGKSAISKETAESAVLGALGSFIGTPSMRRSDYQKVYTDAEGKQRTKFSLEQRERESNFEYFQRISPWRSGLSASIKEHRDKKMKLKEDKELIEEWLSNKENLNRVINASSTLSWARQMDDNAIAGDEFGFRNTVLGKTINDALILDKIKHTEFYKDVMTNMQNIATADKYNPNDQSHVKAVKDVKEDINTQGDFEGMSDEQIFNRLKENANKYLSTMESIVEESDKISELIGYVDEDTRESLIYEKLVSEDLERRRKTIISEVTPQLGKVTNSINTTSGFSEEQRRAYVLQESTKKVKESNKKLEDTISTLSSEVKRLEDKKKSRRGFSQEDAKKLEENKRKLKRAKNNLKEINKELNKLNVEFSDKNTILSETEILNLPSDLRTYILDPKHLEEYSKEQQDVIKNIQASLGPSTFSKVIDLGRIDNSIRKKNLNYINILHNHRDYTKAVSKAKEEASRLAVKHDIDRLNSMSEEEYYKYVEELNTISNRDYYTQYLYNKYLDKNNNNYKKYSEQNNMFLTLSKRVSNDLKNNVISSTKARYLSYTLDYIKERGADITDISNSVFPILSEQDDAGEFKLLEYFKSREIQLDEKNRVNVPIEIGSAIENFNQLVSRVNSSIKEATEIEEKTKENPTPKEVTASSIVIGREDKEVKEFSDEEIEEEFGYLRDQFHTEDSDQASTENTDVDVDKLIESFKKELTNLGMSKSTVEKLVSDLENSIATSKNVTSGIENFKKKALGKHIRIALERAKLVVGSVEKEHGDSNINSQEQIGNTSVNHISSVNLDNIPENSTLGSFVKEHNIDAYIKANEQTLTKENVPIYFAAIGSVSINYKEQKERDGENYDELQDTTIAILVKDDNGKLVIDGIHYQPIGIVSRSTNKSVVGKSESTKKSLADLRMSIIQGAKDRIVDRLTKDNAILLPVEGTLNNIVKTNSIPIENIFDDEAKFVSKVGTEKLVGQDDSDDESRTFLVVDTASPGEPKHTMSVIIKPISETIGTKTSKVGNVRGVPIIELIKEAIDKNNTWYLSQANSRLTNFFNNTNNAIRKLLEYHVSGRHSDKENSTKNAFNFINKDSIYFGNIVTTISYDESSKQYIINFNNKDVPDLIISEQDLIVLSRTIEEKKKEASYRLSNKVALQLLNNIVFDGNGGIRYNSDGYPLAKWQVFMSNANTAAEVENSPNPDIKTKDAQKANEDFKNIYRDNILEISSRQSLEFSVTTSTDNSDQAEVISPVIKKDDGLDVVRVNGTTVTVDPEVGILEDQPKEIEDAKTSIESSYEDPLGSSLGGIVANNLSSLFGDSNTIDYDFTPNEVKENMNKCNGE